MKEKSLYIKNIKSLKNWKKINYIVILFAPYDVLLSVVPAMFHHLRLLFPQSFLFPKCQKQLNLKFKNFLIYKKIILKHVENIYERIICRI